MARCVLVAVVVLVGCGVSSVPVADASGGARPSRRPAALPAGARPAPAKAAGPASRQAPGSVRSLDLRVGGRQRQVLVYLPSPVPRGTMPLVLVYHGAEDTAKNAVGETNMDLVANKRGILVAYPQGYGDSWNEGAGHTPAERAGVNDVAFTHALVAFLERRYRIDRGRIGATGFSNGALMVEDLGCKLAGELRLIVPIEGELPVSVARTCRPRRPIDVVEVHGTADTAIPYNGGRFYGLGGGTTVLSAPASVARWAALDRCRASLPPRRRGLVRTTGFDRCANGARVSLETIAGGTHTWPSDLGQLVANALLGSR